MMKGSNIGIQEKKAKFFNEWERFTSNEGELIKSYYHRFLKLMNDLKRNKHFPEKIASNLKFLNNLQPEWSRYVTIVHQTKDLHTADYTQLYNFLKYNQKEESGCSESKSSKCWKSEWANWCSRKSKSEEEYDLMAAVADLDEIEEVNANCILMANLT
nr:Gag-Pol polyprotein [Tanacetum cinerariifolium]